jgi:hypothetical protein
LLLLLLLLVLLLCRFPSIHRGRSSPFCLATASRTEFAQHCCLLAWTLIHGACRMHVRYISDCQPQPPNGAACRNDAVLDNPVPI